MAIGVQKLMGTNGVLGIEVDKLVMICDPLLYYTLLQLPEFLSMADIGAAATLLTGMVGSFRGIPVIVSQHFPITNADGFVTIGGTNDKGSFVLARRDGVMIGRRRRVEIQSMQVPGTDGQFIYGTMRGDMQVMQAGMVGAGYNCTLV